MKTIILKVTSTEVYSPETLVNIIGDALEDYGIGDAYMDISIFTPPDEDECLKNSNDHTVMREEKNGFMIGCKWFKSLLQ